MLRVRFSALLTLLALVALARLAQGQTMIVGGNIINQTWTPAGSPYIVQGDITVPGGSTLTIQAGTTVQFASSDGQGAGLDTGRIELTVAGSLAVVGTTANPVTFQAQGGSTPNIWYGIVVLPGATSASIAGAVVRNASYAVRSSGAGSALQITGSTFHTSGYGVYLDAGSPTLTDVTAYANTNYGFSFTGSSSPTVSGCVARSNGGYGVYVYTTGGASSTVAIAGCTLHANSSYGLYARAASGSSTVVNLKNSNVTQNSGYGVYRYTSSGSATVNVTYSNVWGNSSANYLSVTPGTGSSSANPLYVAPPANLRLTSNSPSRYAGDTGGDLGPLPYSADATPGLYGTLWVDTTLTPAGSPYAIAGDLTVGPGVTLTVEPGVTLSFAANDLMGSGADTGRGELRVAGTLSATGTKLAPIVFTSTGASPSVWYGIVLLPAAAGSTISHAVVNEASYAVRYESTGSHTLQYLTLHGSGYGFYGTSGTIDLDAVTAYGNTNYGLTFTGSAEATVTNAISRGNGGYGVYVYTTGGVTKAVSITNATIHANSSYGVYARAASGSATTVTINNSILTQNSGYGVYRYTSSGSASVTVTYSDVWGNSSADYLSVSAGTGCLSTNPLYVSAPSDLTLQPTSPCIDAGTAAGAPDHDRDGVTRPLDGDGINAAEFDMGAHELVLNSFCGDGVQAGGEACDEGALNGTYGHCKADCSGLGPHCGDAMPNGPEECDDGNASNTDACLNSCENARCGDGQVQAGAEQCDDGNVVDDDACSNSCQTPRCGDGIVQAGEACDDANLSDTDGCLSTCVVATCGDGYVRADVEACDDGNQNDDDACGNDCALPSCGDGAVQAGEACDDGNASNTDSCLNTCLAATCGDGYVHSGVETCDDSNTIDDDGCSNACEGAVGSCGDGVQDAGEACDDGNSSNTDACLEDCRLPSCGDGYVQAAVEECDDGNGAAGDGCAPDCTLEPDEAGSDGGCGCHTTGGTAPWGSWFLLALAVAAIVARPRRRRRGMTGAATL